MALVSGPAPCRCATIGCTHLPGCVFWHRQANVDTARRLAADAAFFEFLVAAWEAAETVPAAERETRARRYGEYATEARERVTSFCLEWAIDPEELKPTAIGNRWLKGTLWARYRGKGDVS